MCGAENPRVGGAEKRESEGGGGFKTGGAEGRGAEIPGMGGAENPGVRENFRRGWGVGRPPMTPLGSATAQDASAGSGDESFEDALTEEQLLERALTQANDAKLEGNKLFVAGDYEDALSQYELALHIASELPSSAEICSICHANRAVCFLKLGKCDETIKECTKALDLNPSYIKALQRRGEAHEKLEHFEEALADMRKILELDPMNDQTIRTVRRLEPLAAEKREKMKEEMIGKLKEMGNSVLGRFGMSVDNFKAIKDPNTGSYSISFQR